MATYQAISGAGVAALDQFLAESQRGYAESDRLGLRFEPNRYAGNTVPHNGGTDASGFSSEERKLTFESRKILRLPGLAMSAQCCRVPSPWATTRTRGSRSARRPRSTRSRAVLGDPREAPFVRWLPGAVGRGSERALVRPRPRPRSRRPPARRRSRRQRSQRLPHRRRRQPAPRRCHQRRAHRQPLVPVRRSRSRRLESRSRRRGGTERSRDRSWGGTVPDLPIFLSSLFSLRPRNRGTGAPYGVPAGDASGAPASSGGGGSAVAVGSVPARKTSSSTSGSSGIRQRARALVDGHRRHARRPREVDARAALVRHLHERHPRRQRRDGALLGARRGAARRRSRPTRPPRCPSSTRRTTCPSGRSTSPSCPRAGGRAPWRARAVP